MCAVLDASSAMAQPLCFRLGATFGVKKECPVRLPPFHSQESPGLHSTSSTPSQQPVSGEDMWLLPKHSLLLLLSTHSVENNPNGNSENPQPNRLISMKKLFSRKKRLRGKYAVIDSQEQPQSEIQTLCVFAGTNTGQRHILNRGSMH